MIASENNFSPETSFGRLYFVFTGTAGLIVTTLALTYILHVYTALQERDSLGLELHLLTDQTNDAAELLAGLGAHGHMHSSYTELGNAAAQLAAPTRPTTTIRYSFSFALRSPTTPSPALPYSPSTRVSLVKSGLDDEEYRWLKESATLAQLRAAAERLVNNLFESLPAWPARGTDCRRPCGG